MVMRHEGIEVCGLLRRGISLMICVVLLLTAFPVCASVPGGPDDTIYAIREEDIYRYFPMALLLNDEWTDINKACMNASDLAGDIISADANNASLKSILRDSWKVVKQNVIGYFDSSTGDYARVCSRNAVSAYYRELIGAEDLSLLSSIEDISDTYGSILKVLKTSDTMTDTALREMLTNLDSLKLLMDSFGSDTVDELFDYFLDGGFMHRLESLGLEADVVKYSLDAGEYLVAYLQMIMTDVTLLDTLIDLIDPSDTVYDYLIDYKQSIQQDFWTYFTEGFLSDIIVDKLTGLLGMVAADAIGGLTGIAVMFFFDILSTPIINAVFQNASVDELTQLAVYMQFDVTLYTTIKERLNSIAQGADYEASRDDVIFLLACYIQGSKQTLDLCETVLGKRITLEQKRTILKIRAALESYSYYDLVQAAAEYADTNLNNGNVTCDCQPYAQPYAADLPAGERGEAMARLISSYPPNTVVGIASTTGSVQSFTKLVLIYMTELTGTWQHVLFDKGDKSALMLATVYVHRLKCDMLEELLDREIDLESASYETTLNTLRKDLQNAEVGDVLSMSSTNGIQVSLVIRADEDSITLYDTGSQMRGLVYSPEKSLGLYTVTYEDLASWFDGSTAKDTGYGLYRITMKTSETEPVESTSDTDVQPETAALTDTGSASSFKNYFYANYDPDCCALYYADLTHDGKQELVVVDYSEYWKLCTSADDGSIDRQNIDWDSLKYACCETYNSEKSLITIDVLAQNGESISRLDRIENDTIILGSGGDTLYLAQKDQKTYLMSSFSTSRQGEASLSIVLYDYPQGVKNKEKKFYTWVLDLTDEEIEAMNIVFDDDTFDARGGSGGYGYSYDMVGVSDIVCVETWDCYAIADGAKAETVLQQ